MADLIERLSAELVSANKHGDPDLAALIREAAAALEAAREDSERLDWLASESDTLWVIRDRGGYELPYFAINSGRERCDPGDLRQAIDQAAGAAQVPDER